MQVEMSWVGRELQTVGTVDSRHLFRLHNFCMVFERVLIQSEVIHKVMVERVQISLEEFHKEWIEQKREETDGEFNFSEWVREQIEDEAKDAPAYL